MQTRFNDKPVASIAAIPLGRLQALYANFFKVVNDPMLSISKFHVKVTPELPCLGSTGNEYNGI